MAELTIVEHMEQRAREAYTYSLRGAYARLDDWQRRGFRQGATVERVL